MWLYSSTLFQVNYCLNLLLNSFEFDQDALAFLNILHYACSVYFALDIYCTLLYTIVNLYTLGA